MINRLFQIMVSVMEKIQPGNDAVTKDSVIDKVL